MARSKAAPPADQGDRPPLFDPVVHTDPHQMVFAELYCLCGSLWRQRDPVWALAPMVAEWMAAHAGDGHGATSKANCVAEREAQREAAFRLARRPHEYRPKGHPNLDTTCTRDRPWPVFPTPTES